MSRGSVTLASTDPLQPPLMDPNFLAERDDVDRLVRGFNQIRALLNQPALAGYRGQELPASATAQSDPHLVFNLHVVLALQIAAELAQTFESELVTIWQADAAKLQQRCRDWFRRNGRFHDDLAHTTYSQLGAAMALLTGTATPAEADALLDEIVARSLNARDDHEAGRPSRQHPHRTP